MIPWLTATTPFPDVRTALDANSGAPGLLAASQDLDARRLIDAYSKGIFPWYEEDQPVLWWSTDPRMVLAPAEFRLHKSLQKSIGKALLSGAEVRFDGDFTQVIKHCSQARRSGQIGTWISPQIITAYSELHQLGLAHSIEIWSAGRIIAGLYCVTIGKAVFGESMFTLEPSMSKMALAALVAWSREHSIELIDCQQETKHLAFMGAKPIPRSNFGQWLAQATTQASSPWQFDPLYWNNLGIATPQK